jgi:hypothetical protein
MGSVRREYWIDDDSKSVWAVALSQRDGSVVACAGPFTPKVAAIVDVHQLVYVGGPTLEWLRSRREHFRPCGLGEVETVRAPAPRGHDDGTFDALLTEARRLTRAEAGTVYVRDGGVLRFAAAQNEVLERRLGLEEARRRMAGSPLSLEDRSIASYVLLTHLPVNMPDAYDIPIDLPYVFNRAWDVRNDYVTRSVLALPIREPRGPVFGVLQIINARGARGASIAFSDEQIAAISVLVLQWTQRLTMR